MDYAKMGRLARDPGAIRLAAGKLLSSLHGQLDENARSFLTELTTFEGPNSLSVRRQEYLFSLMARAGRREMVGGYRAATLINDLYGMEFSEDDEAFVNEMHERGPDLALTEGQWEYVFHLCKRKRIIDHWVKF